MLLIRDPAEVVASYIRSREACAPEDIGLLQQLWLFDELSAGRPPPVIDAGDFLRDPEAHLRWLCDWLGIAFTAGCCVARRAARHRRLWAPHWYDAVWASTGFEPRRPREVELLHGAAVAEACRPAYGRCTRCAGAPAQ